MWLACDCKVSRVPCRLWPWQWVQRELVRFHGLTSPRRRGTWPHANVHRPAPSDRAVATRRCRAACKHCTESASQPELARCLAVIQHTVTDLRPSPVASAERCSDVEGRSFCEQAEVMLPSILRRPESFGRKFGRSLGGVMLPSSSGFCHRSQGACVLCAVAPMFGRWCALRPCTCYGKRALLFTHRVTADPDP